MAGFLLVAALHALNPDALIARTNLARALAGRTFDVRYAASLGADAVPELVAGLPVLNPQGRCALANDLLRRWPAPANADWRTWSLARARAWRAVSANASTLHSACVPR